MGIQGLLPLIKSIHSNIHIKDYDGKTVAVDAYGWLHKGAFSCALELCQDKPTTKYVNFCMQRIHMLKFYNVTPLIVFDGGYLPAKASTEAERQIRRDENKAKGIALLREGKKQQAVECFQKCVDVTPEMAYQFIKALRSESVQYVVAPYEADAQLAYLSRTGKVDAVITEDSDLIVFGCERIIYKLDQYGACVEIRRDRFAAVTEVNFVGWTDELLRQMCILSGCDYLPSIPGMGLKTAHRMLRQLRTAEKVIRSVRMDGQLRVPPDYEKAFRRAELTFRYQRVYDLDARALTTVNPVPQGLDISEMDFLGPLLEPEVARGIATGDLNPITKEPIVDLTADASKDQENIELHARRKPVSPWLQRNKTFRPKPSTTPNAKSITNYFKPVTPVPLSQLIESNLPEDVAGESQATVQAEMDQLDMSPSQDSLFVPSTPTQKCTPPEILSPASAASSLKRRASDSYAFHRGHDDPNRPPRPVNVFSKPSPSPSHSASIATNKKMTISRFFGGAKTDSGGGGKGASVGTFTAAKSSVVREFNEAVQLSLETHRLERARFEERRRAEKDDVVAWARSVLERGPVDKEESGEGGAVDQWLCGEGGADDATWGAEDAVNADVGEDGGRGKWRVWKDLEADVTAEKTREAESERDERDEVAADAIAVDDEENNLREEEMHRKIAIAWKQKWTRKDGRVKAVREAEAEMEVGEVKNLLLINGVPQYQFNSATTESQNDDVDVDRPSPKTVDRQSFTFKGSTSSSITASRFSFGSGTSLSPFSTPGRGKSARGVGLPRPVGNTRKSPTARGGKVDKKGATVRSGIWDQFKFEPRVSCTAREKLS